MMLREEYKDAFFRNSLSTCNPLELNLKGKKRVGFSKLLYNIIRGRDALFQSKC